MSSLAVTPARPPTTTHVRAWLASPLWRLIGHALFSLPLGLLDTVVGLIGPGSFIDTLAQLERRRAGRVLAIVDGGSASSDHARDARARSSDRKRLLASAPLGLVVALIAALSVFLIFRALCEIAFIWLWPAAFVGAWGGTMAGVLAVHCTPGLITLLGGPWAVTRSVAWAARRWESDS